MAAGIDLRDPAKAMPCLRSVADALVLSFLDLDYAKSCPVMQREEACSEIEVAV